MKIRVNRSLLDIIGILTYTTAFTSNESPTMNEDIQTPDYTDTELEKIVNSDKRLLSLILGKNMRYTNNIDDLAGTMRLQAHLLDQTFQEFIFNIDLNDKSAIATYAAALKAQNQYRMTAMSLRQLVHDEQKEQRRYDR